MALHTYVGLTAIAALLIYNLVGNRRKRLPPGPKPLPFIGNLLDYPKEKSWLVFTEWRQRYGDVVYMNMLGKHMVILNSFKACRELLEKRSSIYSDRPPFVMAGELVGWEWDFGLIPYSQQWRYHRRLFHLNFHENMTVNYYHVQERCTHGLLRRLLEEPDRVQDHTRLLFGESILEVVYGIVPKGRDDVFIRSAEDAVYTFSQACAPGRWVVDTFPILKFLPSWFPGAGFHKQAKEWNKVVMNSRNLPAAYVQRSLQDGTARPSVLASLLTNCGNVSEAGESMEPEAPFGESLQDAAISACGVAYVAGADTTLSATQAFFLTMANYPHYQKAAQEELDAVVGGYRLPVFEDMNDLPYVVAITKEILRWHVVLPLAIPHALMQDDEYEGYLLPQGTVVIPNTWALLHDPEIYPDPDAFKPERWLLETSEGYELNPEIPEPEAAFGYGRRICPGRHFARASLFITVANILACYDIKPVDETGKPVQHLPEDFTDGLLSYPIPYNVSIVPRSDKAAQLVRDTAIYTHDNQ